jgi:signal peptidase II
MSDIAAKSTDDKFHETSHTNQEPMNLASKPALAAWIIGGVALDQATKIAARAMLFPGEAHNYLGGIFRVQLVQNHGAFLSLGATLPEPVRQAILLVGVGIFVAALIWYVFFSKTANDETRMVSAWVAAGGLGNLIDRALFQGGVTDFLNLGIGNLRTGIFNVADMYITFTVIFLLWGSFRKPKAAKL